MEAVKPDWTASRKAFAAIGIIAATYGALQGLVIAAFAGGALVGWVVLFACVAAWVGLLRRTQSTAWTGVIILAAIVLYDLTRGEAVFLPAFAALAMCVGGIEWVDRSAARHSRAA